MWPWVIIGELEVLVVEGEDVLDVRVYLHLGQRTWGAGELQLCLLQVIEVEVGIAGGVNEVAALQPCHLCHHLKEEGVGCDIEGHTKEGVCAALIELQGEFAVSYIELEQTVTGRAICSTSAGFHALTMMRRELGLFFIKSTHCCIWSMVPPL